MVERSGDDLNLLLNELDKLCALAGEGEITRQHIETAGMRNLEASVFDLAKAILQGQYERAYGIIYRLMDQREEPVSVLSVLSSAYADLYRAKVAAAGGVPAASLSADFQYRGREFRLRNAARDCARLSLPVLDVYKRQVEDTTQYLGYEKERNGGQNGERKITAEVTLVDGIEQSRSILATETISNPVNRVVVVGAKKMNANANIGDGVSTGKFVWPLPSCRRISSDYGNRGSFHAGIDISGNGVYGKDIIAADGGTVVEVNSTNWWGQGYGYYVMIRCV